MTNLNLEEMKRAHAATTQGEWLQMNPPFGGVSVRFVDGRGECICSAGYEPLRNGTFCVRAHQWLPQLIERVERLQRENERLEKNQRGPTIREIAEQCGIDTSKIKDCHHVI